MLRVIVSFGREDYEHRRFREQGETAVDARVELTVRQTVFTLVVQTATAVGTALVFGFGFRAVFNGEHHGRRAARVLSATSPPSTGRWSRSATRSARSTSSSSQLKASLDLLDIEPEVSEDPRAVEIERVRGRRRLRAASASPTRAARTPSRTSPSRSAPGQRRRDRRPDRRRQDHAREPADPLLRPPGRARSCSTASTSATLTLALAARADQRRAPGAAALLGHDRGEHPLRPAGGDRGRRSSRPRRRPTRTTSSPRCPHGYETELGERGAQPLRRRAPAHLASPARSSRTRRS